MANQDYYSKIIDFYRDRKRMPTYSEVMKLLRFKSKNSVTKLFNKMIDDDLVEKDSSGFIIPLRIYGQARVLGTVEAGWPSPAEEELSDTMSLDEYLINNKEATFMLKVKGDSMIDAGIMPGDMVLVERGKNPKYGDVVIAEVDNGWTMKYLHKDKGQICLRPANSKYSVIYPKDELKITAVVTAVIRKY